MRNNNEKNPFVQNSSTVRHVHHTAPIWDNVPQNTTSETGKLCGWHDRLIIGFILVLCPLTMSHLDSTDKNK